MFAAAALALVPEGSTVRHAPAVHMEKKHVALALDPPLPAALPGSGVQDALSVAIDGISLTVNSVDADGFAVAIIPHSLEKTTLKDRREGDSVNIETDLIGRYVERFLQGKQTPEAGASISREFLAKNGFL